MFLVSDYFPASLITTCLSLFLLPIVLPHKHRCSPRIWNNLSSRLAWHAPGSNYHLPTDDTYITLFVSNLSGVSQSPGYYHARSFTSILNFTMNFLLQPRSLPFLLKILISRNGITIAQATRLKTSAMTVIPLSSCLHPVSNLGIHIIFRQTPCTLD